LSSETKEIVFKVKILRTLDTFPLIDASTFSIKDSQQKKKQLQAGFPFLGQDYI
jgi:hypothetical protein